MAYYKCGKVYTTQNSNVVVDTASGAVANFQTPLAMPLKSLTIDVNAKQDLHGQSNPYPAGGGKNILDKSSYGFVNGANIIFGGTVQGYADGSLTLRAGTYTFSVSVSCNGLYVSDSEAQIEVAYNKTFVTFTIAEDKAIKLMIYKAGVTQEDILSYNYQLEVGSTATSYAPYENICPISGWNEISPTKCGVNLWDEETENGYLSSSDGSFISNANSICSKNFRLINPSAQVYVATSTDKTMYICWYDEDNTFISRAICGNTSVTSPLNARYFKLSCYNYGLIYNDDTSVNYPSNDTTYHAYNGNTEVINLGGTYYGGHFTQDKNGNRQFEVTWCGLTDLSSLPWGSASNGRIGCNPTDMAVVSSGAVIGNIKSDCYAPDTQNNVYNRTNDKTIAMTNNLSTRMMLYDSNLGNKTSTEVKAALSGRNVIYGLLEPITIDLPDGEPIITLNGTNNVFADTGDTSLQFRKIG